MWVLLTEVAGNQIDLDLDQAISIQHLGQTTVIHFAVPGHQGRVHTVIVKETPDQILQNARSNRGI